MDLSRVIQGRQALADGTGKALRRQAGLSLAELAAAVGVNAATVYRWEQGTTRPSADAAERYALALETLRLVVAA